VCVFRFRCTRRGDSVKNLRSLHTWSIHLHQAREKRLPNCPSQWSPLTRNHRHLYVKANASFSKFGEFSNTFICFLPGAQEETARLRQSVESANEELPALLVYRGSASSSKSGEFSNTFSCFVSGVREEATRLRQISEAANADLPALIMCRGNCASFSKF
jgi:hypothetical protein